MAKKLKNLCDIVRSGDEVAVRAALGEGLDANAVDDEGETPLEGAVGDGNLSIVRALLEFGARPGPALGAALSSWNEEAPAQAAEVLAELLDAGADANWQDESIDGLPTDRTALYLAVKHPEFMRVLLQHGADPNRATSNGETPLSFACDWGLLESVRTLLAGGANPDHVLADLDWSVLFCASASGHREVVGVLLDAGADPLRVNDRGQTALCVALDHQRSAVAHLLLDRAPAIASLGAADLASMARGIPDEALARRIESLRGS